MDEFEFTKEVNRYTQNKQKKTNRSRESHDLLSHMTTFVHVNIVLGYVKLVHFVYCIQGKTALAFCPTCVLAQVNVICFVLYLNQEAMPCVCRLMHLYIYTVCCVYLATCRPVLLAIVNYAWD